LFHDGKNVNIPAFWESIFGRRHIKEAKQVFQDLGDIGYNPIPDLNRQGTKLICVMNCNGERNLQ
jgi:hypothetical protein